MARRTSPDGPTDSRADSPGDSRDGRADGLADILRLPGRFRVGTSSGVWLARMGTPDGPGALERLENGQPVQVCPLPEVIDSVVYRDTTGRIVRRAIRIRWHGAEAITVDVAGMARDDAWIARVDIPKDPKAIQHMASAVCHAAQYVAELEGDPHWKDDDLRLPPDHPAARDLAYRPLPPKDLAGLSPKLALVAGAALGGCYVVPLNRESFILHLVGDSSLGKTTALHLADAMLTEAGPLKTWNITSVALGRHLAGLCVLPAVFDELGASGLSATDIEKTVFRVTDGTQRQTATRTGAGVVINGGWRSVLISSGNRGLVNATKNPGLAARVVELRTPITRDAAEAAQIRQLIPKVAGWPLRWLVEDPAPDRMAYYVAEAEQELRADRLGGVPGRLARHLALCVAGARLLGWYLGRVDYAHQLGQAALVAARQHLQAAGAELGERGHMADQLYDALTEAYAARPYAFPDRDLYRPQDTVRPIEGLRDGPRLQVLVGALERIAVDAGIPDPLPALRDLRARGVLQSDRRTLGSRTHIAGAIVRVYTFRTDQNGESGAREAPARTPKLPQARAAETENRSSEGVARTREPVSGDGRDRGDEKTRWDALGRRLAALDPGAAERVTDLGDLAAMEAALDRIEAYPPPPPLPPAPSAPHGRLRALREPLDLDTRRAMFARALPGTEAGPDDIAAGLAALEAAAGLTYEAPTPARAGLQWIHALERVPLEAQTVELPAGLRSGFALTDPAQADQPGDTLWQIDQNASYANGAQMADLGTGPPTSIRAPRIEDLRHPGWVTIANPRPGWPAPFHLLEDDTPLATPLARLLAQWVGDLDLADATIWPTHRRALRNFARRCLDARARLAGAGDPASALALAVLKAVYAAALGGMLASGPDVGNHNRTAYLRPDWAALIRAGAAASMWRQLHTTSPGPAAVITDAAFYVDQLPALELSAKPGKWKTERRARLTPAIRDAIRYGQPGTVRKLAHDNELP